MTLLSDANVPVRFRAQQPAKYSYPQLTANSIAAQMCLRHSDIINLRITNHRRQKISTVIYAPFIQNSNQMDSRLTATTSFPRVFFQL